MQYSIQSSKIDRVDAHQVLLCLKISSLIHYQFFCYQPRPPNLSDLSPGPFKTTFPVNHSLLKTYCIMLCVKGNLQTIFRWLIIIDFITMLSWLLPLSKGHRNTYALSISPDKSPRTVWYERKKKDSNCYKKSQKFRWISQTWYVCKMNTYELIEKKKSMP